MTTGLQKSQQEGQQGEQQQHFCEQQPLPQPQLYLQELQPPEPQLPEQQVLQEQTTVGYSSLHSSRSSLGSKQRNSLHQLVQQ
ncbi:uncharacterized protein ACOB8E_018966 isoform 2-T2 [Sarcophilus harrisii]